jgi:hypothetical protein
MNVRELLEELSSLREEDMDREVELSICVEHGFYDVKPVYKSARLGDVNTRWPGQLVLEG